MQPEKHSMTDPFDASAFAFAAVMREAVEQNRITLVEAERLSDRMGEIMDHLVSGGRVMAGKGDDGSFTLELLG